MKNVHGDIKSFKASERESLERLAARRSSSEEIIDTDLARRAGTLAQQLGAQIGLLIDRDGHVAGVAVGKKTRLYLPDLGRFRLGASRLRRLRLVVFVPEAENILGDRLQRGRPAVLGQQGKFAPRQKGEKVIAPEISADLITDLEKLRLDLVLVVAVLSDGKLGPCTLAYLSDTERPGGEMTQLGKNSEQYGTASLAALDVHFPSFIAALEGALVARGDRGHEVGGDPAVLVGAYTGTPAENSASMDELRELARTAGIRVVDTVIQRRKSLDPRTVVGKGKIEELVLHCLDLGAELVVFDRELSPGQLRSITNLTELKVIDRSMLILDIFAQRAVSSEGRMQVELAQLKYSLPRLTETDTGLSRLTGGIGGRGPGETKLEIGRRRARDRIVDLERRIDRISEQRGLRRERRQNRGVPVIAIVGYTNAGKSTLLNALTKGAVLVENRLFATLDPSSRRMRFPNDKEVIFVDTVGFIRELPKELVTAFRATLEEVGEADLLVHVIDASNPEYRKQISVVSETLSSLGFGEKPKIFVFNKIDLLSDFAINALLSTYEAIAVSALHRQGFEELIKRVQDELQKTFRGQDPGRFTEIPGTE